MYKETLNCIIEEVSERYNISMESAKKIVIESFFPKALKTKPEFVCHFNPEYWADEIMSSRVMAMA